MADKVYITPHGARQLRDELNELWRVTRPEVTKNVSDAAALGDRSENADYIYGKKRLREIDKRIRYLTKRLDNLEIVDRIPDRQDTVYFGAWVKLESDDGDIKDLRIVSSAASNASRRFFSFFASRSPGFRSSATGVADSQ